MLNPDWATNY